MFAPLSDLSRLLQWNDYFRCDTERRAVSPQKWPFCFLVYTYVRVIFRNDVIVDVLFRWAVRGIIWHAAPLTWHTTTVCWGSSSFCRSQWSLSATSASLSLYGARPANSGTSRHPTTNAQPATSVNDADYSWRNINRSVNWPRFTVTTLWYVHTRKSVNCCEWTKIDKTGDPSFRCLRFTKWRVALFSGNQPVTHVNSVWPSLCGKARWVLAEAGAENRHTSLAVPELCKFFLRMRVEYRLSLAQWEHVAWKRLLTPQLN